MVVDSLEVIVVIAMVVIVIVKVIGNSRGWLVKEDSRRDEKRRDVSFDMSTLSLFWRVAGKSE